MPRLTHRVALELASNLRAFLRLEAGLVRGAVPEPDRELRGARWQASKRSQQLEQAQQRLAGREKELAEANPRLAALEAQPGEPGDGSYVESQNLVWIFGTGRGGSTWLRSMMCGLHGFRVWEEPMVGLLFGQFYERAQEGQLSSHSFVFGEPARAGWIRSIRKFILDRAGHLYPSSANEPYLVVKEPNGSAGAPPHIWRRCPRAA